ncbi:hypothetical protein [Streptomyces abikoensis]|uniref:Uncharacterized protein n=1 Tax=Streptomyces abikoensis TaxID=97398 RepID=A0ABW7TF81_9ACTN
MPSSLESDHPFDESAEEIRRKERERAEVEAKLARRERMKDQLRILQMISSLIALATGDPAYRWVARCVQWVMERFGDSE